MTREEAIKIVKSATVYTPEEIEALETLIPELAESEDERIRKVLIEYFREWDRRRDEDETFNGVSLPSIITYLEKQEEQKSAEWDEFQPDFEAFKAGKKEVIDNPERYGLCRPAEWSDEDEKMLLSIINAFRNGMVSTIGEEQWLKSLPKRFNLQPKLEWGEGEMKVLDAIIDDYEKAAKSFCGYDGKIGVLKAIRDGKYNLPKPAEWSDEDERMYKAVSVALTMKEAKGYLRSWYITPEEADTWLKSLPSRLNQRTTGNPPSSR